MGSPLAGYDADVWVSSSTVVTATNEACTDSGDHTTYTANTHFAWDKQSTFTVQCSPDGLGSWSTVTDYVVHWPVGSIVFNTARTVGVNDHVRIASGKYFTLAQLDTTYNWSLSLKGKTANTTPFQTASAWEQYTATTRGGSGKISTWQTDDLIFKELGNLLVMQLFVDKSGNIRWQFYAHATGVDMNDNVSRVMEQPLSFQIEGEVFFLNS